VHIEDPLREWKLSPTAALGGRRFVPEKYLTLGIGGHVLWISLALGPDCEFLMAKGNPAMLSLHRKQRSESAHESDALPAAALVKQAEDLLTIAEIDSSS
jgi:hypothetical protein